MSTANEKIKKAGRKEALAFSRYISRNNGDRIGWLAQYLKISPSTDYGHSKCYKLNGKLESLMRSTFQYRM